MFSLCQSNRLSWVWSISITLHPELPSLTEQVSAARVWTHDVPESRVFVDDVMSLNRIPTNWNKHLLQRKALVEQLTKKNQKTVVFFHSPMCIGITETDARKTIKGIFEHGAKIFLHSHTAIYCDGDDLSHLITEVKRMAKAAAQRRWEKKSKAED